MITTPQITVDARMFRAASEFQSREETRYYLNGVYVQPHPEGGALLVATDGHRMLVVRDKDGKCAKAAIVSSEPNTFKLMGKEPSVLLSVDDQGITTCGSYRSQKSTTIDGTFPDWAQVIKPVVRLAKERFHDKPVFEPGAFNAEYLASFQKVHKHLGVGQTAMKLVSFTKADPALILFPDMPHIFGVLMPMRNHNEDFAVPAFMRPVLEPATVTPMPKPQARPTKKPSSKKKTKPTRKAA